MTTRPFSIIRLTRRLTAITAALTSSSKRTRSRKDRSYSKESYNKLSYRRKKVKEGVISYIIREGVKVLLKLML